MSSDGVTGEREDHYFATSPASRSRPGTVTLTLPDVQLSLQTDRGVFSAGAIDPGTSFLLEDPTPVAARTGDRLDLGCGYGPIALTLAARAPQARVWAIDVNERARQLCAANADVARLTNVTVAAPEEVPAEVAFAEIWSNPPIRIGKAALHDLLGTWLGRLEPSGRARLVVHKHLGADSLARWLDGAGWPTQRLRSRAGYRILEVTRS